LWESLSQTSALTVFLAIGAIGLIFLLASLLFGEIFEEMHLEADLNHDGPGFFSTRVISVFLTAFGGIGALSVNQGLGAMASSAIGFASGILMGGLIYLYARFLYSQQASSNIDSNDLIGHTAEVTVGIPAGGLGQVRCLIGETMVEKTARSKGGIAIAHNSQVMIEGLTDESLIVSPYVAPGEGGGLFSFTSTDE
jgi:membrane protein implicated in regulation of membrane protease activity